MARKKPLQVKGNITKKQFIDLLDRVRDNYHAYGEYAILFKEAKKQGQADSIKAKSLPPVKRVRVTE
jgi:hypothetical protein